MNDVSLWGESAGESSLAHLSAIANSLKAAAP